MEKHFEEKFSNEIDAMFRHNAKKAQYDIEYNWELYRDYFLEYFRPHSGNAQGKLLLDVGSGTGLVSQELLPYGFTIHGVDFSSEIIKYASFQQPKIHFQKSSIYELPFDDNTFDVIICLGVMQSVQYPEKALLEMRRVLKKGGVLIVRTLSALSFAAVPAKKANPNFNFYNPFSFEEELIKLHFCQTHVKGIYFFGKKLQFVTNAIFALKLYKLLNIFFPISGVFLAHSFYIEAKKK